MRSQSDYSLYILHTQLHSVQCTPLCNTFIFYLICFVYMSRECEWERERASKQAMRMGKFTSSNSRRWYKHLQSTYSQSTHCYGVQCWCHKRRREEEGARELFVTLYSVETVVHWFAVFAAAAAIVAIVIVANVLRFMSVWFGVNFLLRFFSTSIKVQKVEVYLRIENIHRPTLSSVHPANAKNYFSTF